MCVYIKQLYSTNKLTPHYVASTLNADEVSQLCCHQSY